MPTLLGRRIHIAGSISKEVPHATKEAVEDARAFVEDFVIALLSGGASFVVPIDCDPKRDADNMPLLFDWLVLKTIHDHLGKRPCAAVQDSRLFLIAVQHHKNVEQIPDEYQEVWNSLRGHEGLMYTENAGHWNMASKRMALQATHGDVLVTLGGDEGVLFLANLYHEAGKPVVPLNFAITADNKGSRRLFEHALINTETARFFRTEDGTSSHDLINRVYFASKALPERKVKEVMGLLRTLRRPVAFAVRLLNPNHSDFHDVEHFFEAVVQPVVDELGYEFVTVDGKQSEHALINLEIFQKLHRSSVVVADITGERPNCFIELGYALGRGLAVMLSARQGTESPFDMAPVPTYHWDLNKKSFADCKAEFKVYWKANAQRRRIVEPDPLVP